MLNVLERLQQGVRDDEQVRSLVDGASQAMLILDGETRVLAANERAIAFLDTDREFLVGREFARLVAPGDRRVLAERLALAATSGHGPSDDVIVVQGDSGAIRASLTFLPFRTEHHPRLALLVREATNERELDAEVRRLTSDIARKRKLTDLGELMSGVAHELKTPATYIETLAVMSERKLAKVAAAHPELATELGALARDAAEIREGAQRIRAVLAGLQPLTRNHLTARAAVDLSELVRDAVRSFRATPEGADAWIEFDLQTTHPVLLDLREMSRVVLNLLRNASEAAGANGRIRIVTRNRECPPQIRVEDDGPGVPAELERHLFEPFFTTKPEGTGLGLVISKRIVENNGGTLRYERAASGGAAFVVEFERPAEG